MPWNLIETAPKPYRWKPLASIPSTPSEAFRHLLEVPYQYLGGTRYGSGLIPCRNRSEMLPPPYRDILSGNMPNPLPKKRSELVLSARHSPTLPMPNFLTVKEAAKIVGKSPSSIRRIIYPILDDDRHPDRHHIEPDVKTAKALRVKGENFAWKLSEELLRREVPEDAVKSKADSKSSANGDGQSAAIVEILRKQLDIKDQQIAAQNEVIKGLSERVREGNILMGSLQQQLSLTDGSSRKKTEATDADVKDNREEGSEHNPKTEKKTHWLFRKIF